jgi:hypothetical protein
MPRVVDRIGMWLRWAQRFEKPLLVVLRQVDEQRRQSSFYLRIIHVRPEGHAAFPDGSPRASRTRFWSKSEEMTINLASAVTSVVSQAKSEPPQNTNNNRFSNYAISGH